MRETRLRFFIYVHPQKGTCVPLLFMQIYRHSIYYCCETVVVPIDLAGP
jgi:hypothetical protein